jgi:hypothetical protein
MMTFFVFVTFDDVFPVHLFAICFGNAFVANAGQIAGPEHIKTNPFRGLGCGIKANGDVDQPKTDSALPKRSHVVNWFEKKEFSSGVKTSAHGTLGLATAMSKARITLSGLFWGERDIAGSEVRTGLSEIASLPFLAAAG